MFIAPYDPNAILKEGIPQPASAKNPLGTDYLGRDLLSRIVYGARASLLTCVIATMAATAIGILLGMIAAYYYITAAKLSGENKLKLMYKHVFPNAISPIIVQATQSVGGTIMMEAGFSFLGVGIKIPTASWGSIISEARPYLMVYPSYVMIPCVCLAILIISLNLLGDGIRDALDPSLRGEK
ncbi:ABC transporter permease [Butyrivibrio sp. WCD3002]|uniref:ABC transporter permease n=1 Tax=Butyrivibrio sp. WCD3002 TaxID=1280676 RepID=UPI00040362F8|nr:ABC transporter permease [Butyrivibrio sp. WCD3002]